MRSFFSTKYSAGSVNTAMLFLRVGLGILLLNHGYQKITHFQNTVRIVPVLPFLTGNISAALIIFSEFFCSIFVIMGLFTRLACIPILIGFTVVFLKIHHFDFLNTGQLASLFSLGFIAILFIGPGKASIDGMRGR